MSANSDLLFDEDAIAQVIDDLDMMDDEDIMFDQEEEEYQEDQGLRALIGELEERKDRAVRHKIPIEQKWIEDERQYWGLRVQSSDDEDDVLADMPVDNKSAEKVELAAARIGDMLFPTNEPNWALKPPKKPLDLDGQPIDPDQAKASVRQASTYIEDYLNQSNYPKKGRLAVHDSCRIGVGVIKGPFPKVSTKRVMRRSMTDVLDEYGNVVEQTPVVQLEMMQENIPAVSYVDPWMLFLEGPVRDMEECAGSFEMHEYSAAKLAGLVRNGFDEDNLRSLINDGAAHSDHESSLLEERKRLLASNSDEDFGEEEQNYIVWEYHGVIRPELLERLALIERGSADPLEMFWGEIWFCQGYPLKVDLNPIVGDERVPYYIVPYRRDNADIMNSQGVCRVMRDHQRTIDITYEAMQVNTILCSGPQVVHWEGKAVPSDGNYLVDRPKSWKVTDARVSSIADVIQFQNVESTLPQILPVYQIAVANADTATQLPILGTGESANNGQQTASGMVMTMNQQNIVQRKFAHAWDDECTMPLIERMYWWLMQFHEDESIKIDMEVEARGVSYLLVKDKQAQHLLMVMQMAENNPNMQKRINMDELYQLTIRQMDVPVERLFFTDEEMQQQGPDPAEQLQQQIAEAEMVKAKAEAGEAEAKAAQAQLEFQAARENGGMSSQDLARLQINENDNATRIDLARINHETEMMQLAQKEGMSWEQMQTKLSMDERDREFDRLVRAQQEERAARRERAEQFAKGYELRLEAQREQSRTQNLKQGFDSI